MSNLNSKKCISPSYILGELVKLSENINVSFRDLVILAGLEPKYDFRGSNLSGLDFRDEDLKGFDFTDANLSGTDFRRASVEDTIFTGANLECSIGLDEIQNDIFDLQVIKRDIIRNIAPDKKFIPFIKSLKFGKLDLRSLHLLPALTSLEELSLKGLSFDSFDDLAYIKSLRSLFLDNSNVSDLNFIQNNQELRHISLVNTAIISLKPLLRLMGLSSIDISYMPRVRYESIAGHQFLKQIVLRSNDEIDIGFIESIRNITKIDLKSYRINNYQIIGNLESLSNISLSCSISNFEFLKNLDKLRSIQIHTDRQIEAISLKHSSHLARFILRSTGNIDLDFFKYINYANNVELRADSLTNTSVLTNIPYLFYLHISVLNIYDIIDLTHCKNLHSLTLSRIKGLDLSVLPLIKGLVEARIINCELQNVEELLKVNENCYIMILTKHSENDKVLDEISSKENITVRYITHSYE